MLSTEEILAASILIVDDQEANVQLLEQLLRDTGYRRISSTMDPYAVVAMHCRNHYDLIILDLLMPGQDGFQVMAELKEIETDSYVPILVITAQPSHKLRALTSGAKDFIAKPFDLVEVQTRIHNMLEVRLLYKKMEKFSKMLEQTLRERTDELSESEARMRRLIEVSSDVYWEIVKTSSL
jgi:DNA-binding response OmpR family regulator